jgi:quercetin dioxygenase-like cupin family protein
MEYGSANTASENYEKRFFSRPVLCYAEEMNNVQNYKILFQDICWEHPLKGARFKAYEQDGKTIRLVEFTQELIEPDWCRKGHIGYVLSGRLEINFDGEIIAFQKGDGIFIPSGEDHKHMATVSSGTVQLILFEEI